MIVKERRIQLMEQKNQKESYELETMRKVENNRAALHAKIPSREELRNIISQIENYRAAFESLYLYAGEYHKEEYKPDAGISDQDKEAAMNLFRGFSSSLSQQAHEVQATNKHLEVKLGLREPSPKIPPLKTPPPLSK